MDKIKKLRHKSKMSQREFSKKFGIPVRTLQKWEQEESDPTPYLLSLIQAEITLEEYLDYTKYMIKPHNKFKRVIKNNFLNIEKVHPIQQKRIFKILKELKKHKEVKKVVVFGSSVTSLCNYESDIDLYVELSEDKNVKTYDVDCPVDYWTNFSTEKDMLDEIVRKGVVVYAR